MSVKPISFLNLSIHAPGLGIHLAIAGTKLITMKGKARPMPTIA